MGNTAAHGGLNEGYQGTRIAPIPTGLGVGQRALQAGGFAGGQTTIEQFNMVTTGNASQFGNLAVGSYELSAMSNTTRCLFAGGEAGDDGDTDRIEYVEFASQGNGADFGNLLEAKDGITGGSNQTRGLTAGGTNPDHVNVVEYVTLATLGNGTDFGNLSSTRRHAAGVGGQSAIHKQI
jgi:hypothetical protein